MPSLFLRHMQNFLYHHRYRKVYQYLHRAVYSLHPANIPACQLTWLPTLRGCQFHLPDPALVLVLVLVPVLVSDPDLALVLVLAPALIQHPMFRFLKL